MQINKPDVQVFLNGVQGLCPWRGVGCPHLFPTSCRRRRHKQLAHGVGYDMYVCASITEICGKRKEIHDKNYQNFILLDQSPNPQKILEHYARMFTIERVEPGSIAHKLVCCRFSQRIDNFLSELRMIYPNIEHTGIHFDVVLRPISTASIAKGLIFRLRVCSQLDSVFGDVKCIFVPVNNLLVARKAVEERIRFPLLCKLYFIETDRSPGMSFDRSTQSMCQQLTTQAKSKVGDILLNSSSNR